MVDRPMGKILKVINNEALAKPDKPFIAKGAKVVTLDNKVIGKLDHPIGRVDQPYQVIRLNSNFDDNLVGQLVIAKISKGKSKNRRRHRK